MRRNILITSLMTVAIVCIVGPTASGQTSKAAESSPVDDRQVLRALLDEMRQLRLVLQRSNVVSYRLQVTLERLRLQQARVDSLRSSLATTRYQLADLKSAQPRMKEQIKDGEDLIERTQDPNRRAELDSQIRVTKSQLSQLEAEYEQLLDREAATTTELQSAQAKLSELDDQLENMLRKLEAP